MTAAAAGRNVWVVGGGALAGQFADHGLLTEIVLPIAPVMLGSGAPLLPRRLTAAELTLTDSGQDGAFAFLSYAVTPQSAESVPAQQPVSLAARVARLTEADEG